VKILVLASKHVRELLTYRECADVMREALAGLARGQIQQPLRTVVRPRERRLYGPDAVLLPGGGLRAEGAGHHAGQPGSARTRTKVADCWPTCAPGSHWR
jgi:Predicted ornithine cyclodeaminase, mu-crystallin homolog